MSVYKRAGQDTYSYDFQLRSCRFSGDTRSKTKREVERIEAGIKKEARRKLSEEAALFSDIMTFETAASRWWLEVGQHHKNDESTLRDLEWLKLNISLRPC